MRNLIIALLVLTGVSVQAQFDFSGPECGSFNVIRNTSLKDGLLMYWSFDDGASPWTNKVTIGTNSVIGGSSVSGKVGTAMTGQANGCMNASNNLANFSISVWAYPTSAQSYNNCGIFEYGGNTTINQGGPQINMQKSPKANAWYVYVTFDSTGSTSDQICLETGTLPQNVWTHFVVMRDTGNYRFYTNGVKYTGALYSGGGGVAVTNIVSASTPPWIMTGQSTSNGTGIRTDVGQGPQGYPFTGYIDEIGLWNRPLTQAEVTRLYNANAGLAYPNF